MFIASLAAIFILRNPVATGIFAVSAAAAVYGMIRAKEPDFFVELLEDYLVIKSLLRIRIRYDDISTVDFYRQRRGLAGAVENFGILMGRLFGNQIEDAREPVEASESKIELKFNGIKWQFFPLPPFMIPRRSWLLHVEDAASLREEINRRLSPLDPHQMPT